MMFLGAMKSIKKIDDNHIDTLAKQGFFESVADLENPLLRLSISFILPDLITKDNVQNELKNISSKSQTVKIKKSWQRLSCLISAGLVAQGVASEIFIKDELFRSETEKPSSCFFDKEKSFLLLHMLVLLYESKDLSPQEKENLLTRVANINLENKNIGPSQVSIDQKMSKEEKLNKNELKSSQQKMLENIQAVISINDFKEINLLKENNNKSLSEISEDLLKEKLHCENIPNFAQKYYETFMKSRNPSSIITYASKIHSLNDKNAEESLRNYIAFTLDDTFVENRYKIENNLHLQKVNESNPLLLSQWRENISTKLDAPELNIRMTSQKFSAKFWMYETIFKEKHLDLEKFDLHYLNKFLNDSDPENLKLLKNNLKLDIEKSIKSRNAALRYEKSIEDLNKTSSQLSEIDFEIKKLINESDSGSEFLVSINNFLSGQDVISSQFHKQVKGQKIADIELQLNNLGNEYRNGSEIIKCVIEHRNKKSEFSHNLSLLIKIFPYLNEEVSTLSSHIEKVSLLNDHKKIKEIIQSAKDTYSKSKLQSLCIQWVEEVENLNPTIEIFNNPQAKFNEKEFTIYKNKYNSKLGNIKKKLLIPIVNIIEKEPFNKPDFLLDINNFLLDINNKINEESKVLVNSTEIAFETDNAIDILLCGTEVANSCQDVKADPSTNRGLLGYLMDGKNKVLVIKNGTDSHSKILTRCLLRLLWDDEEKKPVLYMDTLFPAKISKKHIQALEFIAKRKATLLNPSLTASSFLKVLIVKNLRLLGEKSQIASH